MQAAPKPHWTAALQHAVGGIVPLMAAWMLPLVAIHARAQEAPLANTAPPDDAAPVATPWTYSVTVRTEASDLSRAGQLNLRASLGLRYGRWHIGQTDGTDWHRFGQVLQESNLTYDVRQDSKWSVAMSGSIINLDNNSQLNALRAGRKTLRLKAGVDYRLPNRWSVGLVTTQDLFMRGDGTTLSPTLTYRQPLSEVSTLMLSQSLTWANASHWQSQQALDPLARTHLGAGFGEYAAQLAYRLRLNKHWAVYSQLGAQHTLTPVTFTLTPTPGWTYSGQIGVVYFDH
jgi:hypothetical protein